MDSMTTLHYPSFDHGHERPYDVHRGNQEFFNINLQEGNSVLKVQGKNGLMAKFPIFNNSLWGI